MVELLTSRSRILTRQHCARARYWMDEALGTGFSPVKVAIPLATGGAVHAGLRTLMLGGMQPNIHWPVLIEAAVIDACDHFQGECKDRQLDLDALESQSFVYAEQLALTEALVRLAGTRVIPRLLELYEVLEVERLDTAPLVAQERFSSSESPNGTIRIEASLNEWSVLFRSIPDALVRSRADGDLYVISWKTTSEYSVQRDQDARTDMQGLSEAWAAERRLARWQKELDDWDDVGCPTAPELPQWFLDHYAEKRVPQIRGVQMIYLVKGARRKNPDGAYATQSSLIKGLRKTDLTGLLAPEFATERFYTCTEPHPFKYAKGGTCPGGVNHKRGEDWVSTNVWETDGGVKAWMELLDRGGVGGAGIAALDSAWVMPIPHFRTTASVRSWERQTKAGEAKHARDLLLIRQYEAGLAEHPEDSELWESWNSRLDEVFPQTTERCGDWFHRLCPAWNLCWGPPHVAQDPVGSGLYQIKTQYQPEVESVS